MSAKSLACLTHFFPYSRIRTNDFTTIKRTFCKSSTSMVGEITKRVKQYGKLHIDVPFNVEVRPTDPHDYPDMDTLVVKISTGSRESGIEELLSIDVIDDICSIRTKKNVEFKNFDDSHCLIEAPVQYDVKVRTSGDSGVTISSMISDMINAETERGDIKGEKLQAKEMKFSSTQGGSIQMRKSLQGDIEMKTAFNGSINAEKCLGTSLKMTTENGNVSLGSNYCERAIFSTVNGNLSLNNLHMNASVDISGKGSINVSCLDGSLQAKIGEGDTKINVVRLTGKSHIISEGSIDLVVPRENNARLNLKGSKMSVVENLTKASVNSRDEQVSVTNGEISLTVETTGNLNVTSSSWAESLQLGKFAK